MIYHHECHCIIMLSLLKFDPHHPAVRIDGPLCTGGNRAREDELLCVACVGLRRVHLPKVFTA